MLMTQIVPMTPSIGADLNLDQIKGKLPHSRNSMITNNINQQEKDELTNLLNSDVLSNKEMMRSAQSIRKSYPSSN